MQFFETPIQGAYRVELDRRGDDRGFFARAFCQQEFEVPGIRHEILQANFSRSLVQGTLRGMHYQRGEHAETKVVRCTYGRIFDALVDLRPDSPSYKQWYGLELSRESGTALVIPEGCAHGFLTLEPECDVMYLVTANYAPEHEAGVRWNDPAFGIEWPIAPALISDRDQAHPDFK